MKFGICADLRNAPAAVAAGFGYIEGALSAVCAAEESAFSAMVQAVKQSGLPAEAMNVMLPGTIRLTGPDADLEVVGDYLGRAFSRAQQLGVKVQVFGSGVARAVPEGWPMEQALEQLAQFLHMAGPLASDFGISIAIEPLRPQECNIINTVSDALALAKAADLPNVGVLADWYHMAEQHEGVKGMLKAGFMLLHCHIANPDGRTFPLPGDGADFSEFFGALKSIHYSGRVSVEGNGAVEDYSNAFKRLKECL